MTPTRRQVVAGIAILLGGAAGIAAAQEPSRACYDPASLPLSQKTQRRSLGYVEPSPDAGRHCGLCAFFTASKADCGTCTILTGGPVSAMGVCSSFAARKS